MSFTNTDIISIYNSRKTILDNCATYGGSVFKSLGYG